MGEVLCAELKACAAGRREDSPHTAHLMDRAAHAIAAMAAEVERLREERDSFQRVGILATEERDALRADLEAARGRAEYWKQRAKSAEGHLWSGDTYAGARALHRYTRFEGTPWDELTGQQQALIAAGACAVIAEVNARRDTRKPSEHKPTA